MIENTVNAWVDRYTRSTAGGSERFNEVCDIAREHGREAAVLTIVAMFSDPLARDAWVKCVDLQMEMEAAERAADDQRDVR